MKVRKTNLIVYCSHFLSCWGTRMWQFGMGMFLVRIAEGSLQLTAGYGLASGVTIFLFGALAGDWVDNTPRLKAAQLSLVVTDVLMFASAAVITGYLWYQDDIRREDSWLGLLLQALMVVFAVSSDLTAQARMIAVERDWIVEICGKDSDHLATMTATLRRIDMFSMIVAPIVTGQIMTYIGLVFGAIFIGTWNVVSVFVEFYLMWKVYNTVPALKAKKNARRIDDVFLAESSPVETVLMPVNEHNQRNSHALEGEDPCPDVDEPKHTNGDARLADSEEKHTDGDTCKTNGELEDRKGEGQDKDGERQGTGEDKITQGKEGEGANQNKPKENKLNRVR